MKVNSEDEFCDVLFNLIGAVAKEMFVCFSTERRSAGFLPGSVFRFEAGLTSVGGKCVACVGSTKGLLISVLDDLSFCSSALSLL